MQKFRYFTIPGDNVTDWDNEIHGREVTEQQATSGEMDEETVVWEPGVYRTFSLGEAYEIRRFVNGSYQEREPQQEILRGIHEFLRAIDERET